MELTTLEQKKAALAGVFDRASTTYGQVGPGYFAYFGQRLVEYAGLLPGMRVLDVACGRGAVLFPAAQAVGSSGSVTGIDLSEGMAQATMGEIAERKIANVTVQVMDAEHLDFPDAAFDAVTCGFGIFFLPDLNAALTEFRRVLVPGGRLAVSTWSRDISSAERARWSWYDDLVKSYLPPTPDTASQPASPTSFAIQMDSPETTIWRFIQVGLRNVSVHTETATFAYTSAEDWWQERWSLFFRTPLERLSPEALAALQADALAHARQMYERKDLFTEMIALFTLGTNPEA